MPNTEVAGPADSKGFCYDEPVQPGCGDRLSDRLRQRKQWAVLWSAKYDKSQFRPASYQQRAVPGVIQATDAASVARWWFGRDLLFRQESLRGRGFLVDVGPADWQHRPEPDVAAAPGAPPAPRPGRSFWMGLSKNRIRRSVDFTSFLIGRKAVAWDRKKRCYPPDFNSFHLNAFVCNDLCYFGLFRIGKSMFRLSPPWKICLAIF